MQAPALDERQACGRQAACFRMAHAMREAALWATSLGDAPPPQRRCERRRVDWKECAYDILFHRAISRALAGEFEQRSGHAIGSVFLDEVPRVLDRDDFRVGQ